MCPKSDIKKLLYLLPNWHLFWAFSLLELKFCIFSFLFTFSRLAKSYSASLILAFQWLTLYISIILYRYLFPLVFDDLVYVHSPQVISYRLSNHDPLSTWSLFRPNEVFFNHCQLFFFTWSTVGVGLFFQTLPRDSWAVESFYHLYGTFCSFLPFGPLLHLHSGMFSSSFPSLNLLRPLLQCKCSFPSDLPFKVLFILS